MLRNRRYVCIMALALLLMAAVDSRAQQQAPSPSPQPTPTRNDEQESVKTFTEEVLIPVVAYDKFGRFDPTLEPDDILVLEDDVPQQVRSVRHLPANILLIVDMGSQIGETGSSEATRRIAKRIIASLRPNDQVAIIQNSNRVELLEDWTTDKKKLGHVFDPNSRFFTSNRSRLAECLIAATKKLGEKPVGNSQILFFTDGVESQSSTINYADTVKRIVETQATVHVITYSALARKALTNRHYGLDFEMKRWWKKYGEATKQHDERLTTLVQELGGRLLVPPSLDEADQAGDRIAGDIGAQYIITYSPKRLFVAEGNALGRRRINVFSRRIGLQLNAMRNYVAPLR
jgi:VWFA-related protein